MMALLFAASVVAWTRTALAFGPRAALVTAAALLVYPGYGILFHTPASEPVVAAAFAAWALAVSRAWLAPSYGRFAVVGAATAAAALARPAFQCCSCSSRRCRSSFACLGARGSHASPPAPASHSGSWGRGRSRTGSATTITPSPAASGAFFPFYRAFTTDHIVRPDNGPASRELADAVRRELLPEEPYRSYGITLDEFFERGGPREFEDVVGITDRLWGWDSDYAHMRAVGIEAVEAHPLRYLSGVGKTTFEELWKPLFVALPNDDVEAPRDTPKAKPATRPALPVPSDGELIPAAHQGFFSTTPDGHIREKWTSPVDHSLVFATQAMQRRYDEIGRDAGALMAEVPPYGGNEWLTLQFSRSSKLFPPPILWLVAGLVGLIVRRPKHWVSRSPWQGPRYSSSAFRRSRSTRSSSLRSRSRRRSSSSARRAWSGRARLLRASRRGKRHELPPQDRLKIRQPPGDESWSAHPEAARRFSSAGRDGPTTSHSASSGTGPPSGTNTTVRRSPASQAG